MVGRMGRLGYCWVAPVCLLDLVALGLPMHDDGINWKHFPRYWPFMWGIHRWPVNSPHKGQRRGALMFSFICAWINGWVNNCEADNLRCHRAHYDVTVMVWRWPHPPSWTLINGCDVMWVFNDMIGTRLIYPAARWPADRSESTLAQVMACCLNAPSHITWPDVDLSSVRSLGIHVRALSLYKDWGQWVN